MTGTAETEASEFFDIYKLGVLVIPTNKPVRRKDANDSVYKTKREKYNAVVKEIKDVHAKGRPILVGTISVEVSEHLSRMLKTRAASSTPSSTPSIHQQEAEIVARAGQRGVGHHRHQHGRPRHRHQTRPRRRRRSAACTSSAPNATKRAALTASCAAAARARATPARRTSSSRSRTT